MREIEFRGRNGTEGSWYYGDLKVKDGQPYIVPRNGHDICFKVDPKTAEQYTGLKDKNGMDIFEGDIVTFPKGGDKRFFVEFYDGSFYASAMNGVRKEDRSDVPSIAAYWWGDHGNGIPTIVGNIHDNPELLDRE